MCYSEGMKTRLFAGMLGIMVLGVVASYGCGGDSPEPEPPPLGCDAKGLNACLIGCTVFYYEGCTTECYQYSGCPNGQ